MPKGKGKQKDRTSRARALTTEESAIKGEGIRVRDQVHHAVSSLLEGNAFPVGGDEGPGPDEDKKPHGCVIHFDNDALPVPKGRIWAEEGPVRGKVQPGEVWGEIPLV